MVVQPLEEVVEPRTLRPQEAFGQGTTGPKSGRNQPSPGGKAEPEASHPKGEAGCWNKFLGGAEGRDVWTATGYTQPRIDKAEQVLVCEDRTVAEGDSDREQAILVVHIP